MTTHPMKYCHTDSSPHGQLAYGHLAPWTACPMENPPPMGSFPHGQLAHRQLAPETTYTMDNSPQGLLLTQFFRCSTPTFNLFCTYMYCTKFTDVHEGCQQNNICVTME
jgi:hypothetical protein